MITEVPKRLKRTNVKPLAVVPAPGETEEQAIKAIIDFDNEFSQLVADGKFVLVGDTYVPAGKVPR